MSRKWEKHGLKGQSVMNNFLSFKNEKKRHLFQENGGNVD